MNPCVGYSFAYLRIHSSFRGSKTVVGTQLGILSVFNKNSGWGDCVDRIPG